MRLIAKLLVVLLVMTACGESKKTAATPEGVQEVTVQEVLHVKEYSYIRVLENGQEKWLAVPSTAVEVGGTYYYGKAMAMQNFESKDLNRTFDTVYFIEKLTTDANGTAIHTTVTQEETAQPATSTTTTEDTPPPPAAEGTITLAQLFANKEAFEGKQVTLRGEVTKYNPAIMGVNWFHIQDGTDFEGENDLTVTTSEEVVMGKTYTVTGVVVLNKDFGAGYFYNIIVEKGTVTE